MVRATGIEIVGVCPNCQESTQFAFSRELIKRWGKELKGVIAVGFNVTVKCIRCNVPLNLFLPKAEIKGFLRSFKESNRDVATKMVEDALKLTQVSKSTVTKQV